MLLSDVVTPSRTPVLVGTTGVVTPVPPPEAKVMPDVSVGKVAETTVPESVTTGDTTDEIKFGSIDVIAEGGDVITALMSLTDCTTFWVEDAVALVPGPVIPSVEVVAAAGAAEDEDWMTFDKTDERADATFDKTELTTAADEEGAGAGVVVAAGFVEVAIELAAVVGVVAVMIPLGPNVMAVPEDVVTAPEVSPVVGVVVAGG